MERFFRYDPFIGQNWSQEEIKILVLGFSIYGDKEEDWLPDALIKRIVDWYCNDDFPYDRWMNTYTKFIRAIANEKIRRGGSKECWDKLMFYTFIQEPLIGPRVKPTTQQIESAKEPFKKMLEIYAPDVILPWGKTLYRVLTSLEGHSGVDIDGHETWIYPVVGKEIRMLNMTHPSAGYSWTKWHEVICKMLKG